MFLFVLIAYFIIATMSTPPPPPTPPVHELLERLTKAQETTQRQLGDLQQVVTDAQAEATKTVVQKLDEERGYQFKKKGNEKQFRFNQTIANHIDMAREGRHRAATHGQAPRRSSGGARQRLEANFNPPKEDQNG